MAKKGAKEVHENVSRSVPFFVKVISVLNYINAAFFGLAAALLLVYGISGKEITIETATIAPMPMIVVGIVFLVIGVFAFYLARGLWKGRNWARIFEVALGVIGIVFGVTSIFKQVDVTSNIIAIVINGLITGYLAFDRKVKAAFH